MYLYPFCLLSIWKREINNCRHPPTLLKPQIINLISIFLWKMHLLPAAIPFLYCTIWLNFIYYSDVKCSWAKYIEPTSHSWCISLPRSIISTARCMVALFICSVVKTNTFGLVVNLTLSACSSCMFYSTVCTVISSTSLVYSLNDFLDQV